MEIRDTGTILSESISIVKAGRKAGLPILFVKQHPFEEMTIGVRKLSVRARFHTGVKAPALDWFFDVQDSDYLLVKRRYDGFSRQTSILHCVNWGSIL